MSNQTQEKYVVRMPEGMRNLIRKQADQNRRSMNSEIIYQLEKAYEQSETKEASARS